MLGGSFFDIKKSDFSLEAATGSSDLEGERYNLYNGNIGHMVNTITDPTNQNVITLGNAYGYDQLHRLNSSRTFNNINTTTNAWSLGSTYMGMFENSFAYDANGNIEKQWRKDEMGNEIDSLKYRYDNGTYGRKRNRLYHVNDHVGAGIFADDIDDMGPPVSGVSVVDYGNYKYDELGQLIYDAQEGIGAIDWRNDGKIRSIVRLGSSPDPDLIFSYDPSGNRLSKKVFDATGELLYTNYYLRDAQGNVMAIYKHSRDSEQETEVITVAERNIYGSDRLGIYAYADTVYPLPPVSPSPLQSVHTGHRRYELKNHLGNVTSIVTSHKVPFNNDGDPELDGFTAQLEAAYDYSPFGVIRKDFEQSTELVETNPLAADYRWCFDNTIAETSGSGHMVTALTEPVYYVNGRTALAGKAMNTNRTQDNYIDIVDHANFDFGSADFTVSIWIKKDLAASASGVNSMAVGKWHSNTEIDKNEWCLNVAKAQSGAFQPPQFIVEIAGVRYTVTGTSTLSFSWHHLVGIRQGNQLRLYVNGVLAGTTTASSGAIIDRSGRKIRIGKTDGNRRTRAKFDEFLIYKHALTDTEVSDLFGKTCGDLEPVPGTLADGGYRYGFNGMEKDDEVKGSGNHVDFGARMLDPRLGRWFAVDPLAHKYPDYSPYNYVLNTPISATDPDGRLVLFIGGLRTGKGNADQIGWMGGGGIHNSDVYDYWSTDENSFGRSADIAGYFQNTIGDDNAYFTSGSSFWSSSGSSRYEQGKSKAQTFHAMVQSGEIELADDETIKIVSHSQGGAHASGFADELMKFTDDDGNPIYKIEVMYYITPHQPKEFKAPDGIRSVQFSHPSDAISSDSPGWLPNGGSQFGKIRGVDEFFGDDIMGGEGQPPLEGPAGNRSGHKVTDNDQYIEQSGAVQPRKDNP